jgi:hypothetical protein
MSVALKAPRTRPNDKRDIRPFSVASGRRQERVPHRLTVELKGRMNAGVHETLDVSYNGCFVITPHPVGVNQLVQLLAYLPHGDRVDFVGRVAFVVEPDESGPDKPPGMGLEIFAIDRRVAPQWSKFVETLLDEPASKRVSPPNSAAQPASATQRSAAPTPEREREGRSKRESHSPRLALTSVEQRHLVRLLAARDCERLLRVEAARDLRAGVEVELVCEHTASVEGIDLSAKVVRVEAEGAIVLVAALHEEERRALIHFLVTGRTSAARRLERRPPGERP